ncbi:MAG: hypothetical protein KDA32_05380 [Phycisphaerales bacterium]|nr:hypothetical protein [Phycisphaerales bacterium]
MSEHDPDLIPDGEAVQPPPPSSDIVASAAALETVAARGAVLFPNCYVWCLFLGAMDVMLTYLILHPAAFDTRGNEVNWLAGWVIDHYGVGGMVALKFLSVIVVVLICEFVGRRRYATAKRLAEWAVAINAIPVTIAFTLMLVDIARWRLGYTAG